MNKDRLDYENPLKLSATEIKETLAEDGFKFEGESQDKCLRMRFTREGRGCEVQLYENGAFHCPIGEDYNRVMLLLAKAQMKKYAGRSQVPDMKDKIQKVIDKLEERADTCDRNAKKAPTHGDNQYFFGKKFAYMRAADMLRTLLDEEAPESPDPGGLY